MIIRKEAVASEEASFFLLFYEIRAAIASQSVKYLHIFGRMMFDSRASAELASAGFQFFDRHRDQAVDFLIVLTGGYAPLRGLSEQREFRRSGIIGSPPENN